MDKAFFGSVDGINVSYLENDDFKTGMSAVCVHKLKLSQEIINTGLFFYSAGFHFTVFPTTVMTLVNRAKKNNKVFLINLSVPFKVEFLKDPLWLASLSLILASVLDWSEDIQEIALKTAQLEKASGSHCNSAGFPYGADTAVAVHQGKVNTFDVLKRAALPIVDTSGAGGAFVDGFTSRLPQDLLL
ncbi:Ribokinase-like [Phytophthora cactorum]|nr:Ribokinase-like [Phytophthora cactorum]